MNFTWDIVLNAKRHGTDESELFFRPAKDRSPWYEQAFPILNETRAEGPPANLFFHTKTSQHTKPLDSVY